MAEEIVVFVTASSTEEAKKIAKRLVETKAAACVNIVSGICSIFRWQGEVCDESETLMIIKSQKHKFSDLEKTVKQEHSYDVPEIVALPIVAGSKEYLDWIHEETES